MRTFEEYLKEQNLEALRIAVHAKVRYMTVYNATKQIPITYEHAQQIRQAALEISGVPFTGNFVLTQPEPIEELPTLQMKKLTRHNLI